MAVVNPLRKPTPLSLYVVCGIDATAAVLSPAVNYFIEGSDVALQCGAALIAIATFLGFAYYGLAVMDRSSSDALRDAIASAFVAVYLTIVGWSAFFGVLTDTDIKDARLSPLTQTVISNFTTLTGVVVAFYFSTAAVVRVAETRAGGEARTTDEATPKTTPEEQPDAGSPSTTEE